MIISLYNKEYNWLISKKIIVINIMCKLSFKGNRAVCLCASSLRSLSLWQGSRARALALDPMGRQAGGGTFCLIISLILELSAYSKRVS